ncbi:DUF7657 domain-containing protein [Fibrella aquatilis]|uniref:Uncharacterized protein n=1 Tax=Fibrella aquatilis TaxID=2817059 RepID=A0A939G9X0_9BACT|nr:hypothetical protein [Fibrella aquatilis]MBO0932736.1 hypothetical protein [Fibrella aquatilis]
MSKKKRQASPDTQAAPPTRKPVTVPAPTPTLAAKPQPVAPLPPKPADPNELIRFDRRTNWTLGIIVGLFLLMVLGKLHFVSLPAWNTLVPDGSPVNRGLVSGTAKTIRMDDYAVGAPWIISNINRGYPIENEGIGGLKSAMLTVPAKHIVSFFKPHNWGFFVLDAERGYAWMYDLCIPLLLIGSFLFFMMITRNQYFLSLTGAIALLLSSGTVWWTFIPASMIGYCGLTAVTAVYLLRERKPLRIVLLAFGLVYLCIAYLLQLYPPYQVPMSYLYILVLGGFLYNERKRFFPINAWVLKAGLLAVAVAVFGAVVYLFYNDVKETIQAASSTVYPGQRSESGGSGFIANWFSEYYSWVTNYQSYPKGWLNICEMSHYLTFAPVILPLTVVLFIQRKRIDWMLAGAALFTIALAIYVEYGWPKWLAEKTLVSMAPSRRAQIPLGVGSILLTVIYLSAVRDYVKQVPAWVNVAAVAAILGFMIYTAWVNVNDSEGIITSSQTFLPVLFFTAMNALLLFTIQSKYRIALFCTGLILFLLPNLGANPLSKGLTPITDHLLYRAVRPLVEQNPDARWIVNGSQYVTYLVTATGAKQITGVKYLPERKQIFKVLDPTMKRDSAYNRYAHVTFQTYINPQQPDTTILAQQFEDGYIIAGDPCSPKFKKLNVKYMLYDHAPQIPYEVRCMKKAVELGSMTIYERVD